MTMWFTIQHNLDNGSHSVYSLQYHFVQCVKYRRHTLLNPVVIDLLKQSVHNISENFDVEVLNIECDKDYFHMIFKSKPTLDISKYINTVKTISLACCYFFWTKATL
jgi:putative transposase